MQKDSGFSIFELLTVIAIIAIVVAIALPNMIGSRGDATLRGVVANLKGDLNRAKMMAVRENALVVVNFFTTRYEVFVDNGAGANRGDWTQNSDERRLINRLLPNGVTIDLAASNFDSNRTRFNRRGLPENLGTVVVEASNGNQRQIQLNRLGRINIQ
jgi:prepilin-type N-terminal cleavage/methylation domain-containing protein